MNSTNDMLHLDALLTDHLRLNVVPPLPDYYVQAAMDAIAAVKDGDDRRIVHLPNGGIMRAEAIVDRWNLRWFLEDYEL